MKIPDTGLKKATTGAQKGANGSAISSDERMDIGMSVDISDETEMSLNPSTNEKGQKTQKTEGKESVSDAVSTALTGVTRMLPSGAEVTSTYKKVDPKRVRVWTENTRYGIYDDNQELEASIRALGGNHTAVLLRPVTDNDPDHDYELVYGTQRIQACLNVGKLLYAEIAVLNDADAYILMLAENVRKDPSDWRVISSWQNGLDKGFFAHQGSLADHLGKTRTHVNQLLAILDLPEFFFKQLETDIPKASRKVIKDIGALWRKGMDKGVLSLEKATEGLQALLAGHLKTKKKMEVQSAFKLLEELFESKRKVDKVTPYTVGEGRVKVTQSAAGSLSVSVTANAGQAFMDDLLAFIEQRATKQ
ncbi:ParB N-terminal domain-containing protein [Alteromonas macleodii]|uniref:ParB-like nuclease domain protein n=1 Tax=Alteromonas macleodii TaxID=28108 RepID=A0AB36FKS5_ALTMA|nr:ParB N-terminal domain-containing protein [Alteromonas macleodii]OES24468.1 parB-like nuclease domain protein [Alteromonas macleodii]OES25525.1 parB-like nuclease domain protein [Alteromonas macleodii]OES25827.1 parB-like nuclease domain protein [Alteromonas macleodii]OES38653.1 parB-like nuclease domain protein [Alteromonas macleodii]